MDIHHIAVYTQAQIMRHSVYTGSDLLVALNHKEYVDIENSKDVLFEKRLDFLSMAVAMKTVMRRESHYTSSLKLYFIHCLQKPNNKQTEAEAFKYNQANRTFESLGDTYANCLKHQVDIRDLSIQELYLARKEIFVLQRRASVKMAKKQEPVPQGGTAIDVDQQSVNDTIDEILAAPWYIAAKSNPSLVATILQNISNRILMDTLR